jgi:integrase
LWPEAVQALQAAIDARPVPKVPEAENLVFVTKYGKPWGVGKNVPVSAEFRKILDATGLHKDGRGFYALRHVAETIGGGVKDQVALDLLMGHVRDDMSSHYREAIADSRLEAIAEHIRAWLYGADALGLQAAVDVGGPRS